MTVRLLHLLSIVALASLNAAPVLALDPAMTRASATAAVPAVTAADRVMGRADAPVTVIEYASMTCHHCMNFHKNV